MGIVGGRTVASIARMHVVCDGQGGCFHANTRGASFHGSVVVATIARHDIGHSVENERTESHTGGAGVI